MNSVLIDARARLDNQSAAKLLVSGQSLLQRHVSLARKLGAKKIYIWQEKEDLSVLLSGSDLAFVQEKPDGAFFVMDILNVYKDNSAKVVWRLRNTADIANAEGEIIRSEFFTISKYTLRPLGKKIAEFCYRYTAFKANHLTIFRIVLGLSGAYFFWRGGSWNILAGALVLASWLMDLTDGQLARLRGEISKFGSYLDSVGDGVVDNLYYMAIALSAYRDSGDFIFIATCLAFLFGKYIFVNSTLLLPSANKPVSAGAAVISQPASPFRRVVKKFFSVLDDTDVRIHFLAITGLISAPVVALVFHVFYFNLRWVLNLVNAYYKYEIKRENV